MNKFIDFTVEKIRFDFKTGFIAPLTSHGTLLVNNIHASCYAEINSHLVADWAVTPIKYWYKLRKYLLLSTSQSNFDTNENNVDISLFSNLLYKFVLKYLPFLLVA